MRQTFASRRAFGRLGPVAMGPAAPALMIGASVLSTGMSVMGQIQGAQAQAGMANYQAQVARNNQMIANWNADRAIQRGEVAQDQSRLKTAQVSGGARAALASQGGDVNSGSPLDLQGDIARAGEFDAQTIKANASMEAYGYRVTGAGFGATAAAQQASASNTMAMLPWSVGASLLGGASSVAGKWASYTKNNPGSANQTYGPEFDL